MKGKGKQPAKGGPTFGDALFGIKNMQMDYESFNGAPIVPEPPQPPPKKNPIAVNQAPKNPSKPKPQTPIKPNSLQQRVEQTKPKPNFVMNPGK